MTKVKDIIAATTYWVYGAGPGHYNISSLDKFKMHRAFVGNYVVTQGNLDLRVEPTWQNFKYDTYLRQLKDAGITRIFCTQGAFDWQGVQGKQGKVMPIRDADNALDQNSWREIAELCRQLAIRYANDTAHLLSEAKVYTGTPAYLTNTPKAGLDLLDAIEIQNEWDFKSGWSGATRTITPEEYAVCFKACYDAIRTASKTIKIVMGGGISPFIDTFNRFLGKLDQLYASEGKPTPKDFYLCFHWYMRNGSQDQGGGTAGITPEEAKAYEFGQSMDALCEQRGLLGWYCTETGWASDDSKQSAPILEGFTREQSQGILMIRLALIWGACKYHKGISFWHCANNYDAKPYAAGGVNYRKDAGKPDWSAKPARTICEEFLAEWGEHEVSNFRNVGKGYYVDVVKGGVKRTLSWTNKEDLPEFDAMPDITADIPTEPPTEPPTNPTMRNAYLTALTTPNMGVEIDIQDGETVPVGKYAIYVDGTGPVTLELFKDGSSFIAKRIENGAPLAVGGDDGGKLRLKDFTTGTYRLTISGQPDINFTVGTVTPPPTKEPVTETWIEGGKVHFKTAVKTYSTPVS